MTSDHAAASSTRKEAIIYARVSTSGQAAQEHIFKQLARIWKKIHDEGYTIVDTITEVQDGTLTSQEDRPELHRCLQVAVDRGCVIITVSPSRLSRNAEHAKQLDAEHPGRFVFVKRVEGYAGKPWSVEVAEKHAHLPSTIANGTAIAMHSLQRKGLLRGAPDGGKAGRAASAKARSGAAKILAERIANFLEEDPERPTMKCPALVPLLNAVGIKTTRGETFTESRLRRPLEAAKSILATHVAVRKTLASYGPLRGAAESPAANADVSLHVTAIDGLSASALGDAPGVVALRSVAQISAENAGGEDQPVSSIHVPEPELTEDELSHKRARELPIWGMF